MRVEFKRQCQLRFSQVEFDRITSKAKEDGLTYQKLGELLFGAYLKDNKEVRRLVDRYTESKQDKKQLNTLEKSDLLQLIEDEYSPLKKLEKAIKEAPDK
jgi:hypothetical protein